MENTLAIFSLKGKENIENFVIYGEYEIVEYKEIGRDAYKYPEFSCIKATVNKDGVISDYEPSGCNWYGVKCTCEDILQGVIFDMMIGGEHYVVEYLDAGLKEFIDSYCADSVEIEQVKIPKKILYGTLCDLYTLSLVTDKYVYYYFDCLMIMIDKNTREVISDNCFAESGFWDSVEAIQNGEEQYLWGELPENE